MTPLSDLNLIREFVQIAESGSISAAAKVLGIAQPTLSRHLAASGGADRRTAHPARHAHHEPDRGGPHPARGCPRAAGPGGPPGQPAAQRKRRSLRGHLRIVSVVDVGQWIVSRVLSRASAGSIRKVTTELHLINRPDQVCEGGL
jgi:hypothetical protein